jgi:hypothetical protein
MTVIIITNSIVIIIIFVVAMLRGVRNSEDMVQLTWKIPTNVVKIRFYISDGGTHKQSRNVPLFMKPDCFLPPSQRPVKSEALCNISYHANISPVRVVSLLSSPKARRPPLVSNPLRRIQYTHSYHPCLEAVSFIHNPRTFHAVVARYQRNMDTEQRKTTNANIL